MFIIDVGEILDVIFSMCIVGGVYAVQSERPVHHGGSGLELPLHDGRTRLRHPGSDQQTDDPATQPDPTPLHLLRLHPPLLLHVQGLHENEATVSISHLQYHFSHPFFQGNL